MAQTGAERVERHRQKQRARIEELEGQLADALAQIEAPLPDALWTADEVIMAMGITRRKWQLMLRRHEIAPKDAELFTTRGISIAFTLDRPAVQQRLYEASLEIQGKGIITVAELAEILRESPNMRKAGLLNRARGLVKAATRKGNWEDFTHKAAQEPMA